ncbi:MAG: extensin family protein [Pseudomonadota bacterium]
MAARSVLVRFVRWRFARWAACSLPVIAAGVVGLVILPGVTLLSDQAHAQSLNQIITSLTGGDQRTRRSRSKPNRVVVVPPLPTKQPKPWHTKTFVQTQPYPSTGPEPEWPKVLPQRQTAAGGVTVPSASPRRPPVASPLRRQAGSAKQPSQTGLAQPKAPAVADVYTQNDIQVAQARCRRLLGNIKAETRPEAPIKKGPCGDAAPVKLISLGSSPRVAVVPPAIVNCDMVVALHKWLEKDLQPLARKHLKSPIVKLENMSSYSCRNAYGRKNGRLSEHAKANALDIRGFVTAKGRDARLLSHWGPTGRDIEAFQVARRERIEKRNAELAAKASAARDQAQQRADQEAASQVAAQGTQQGAGGVPPPALRRATLFEGYGVGGTAAFSLEGGASGPSRLGGPKPAQSAAAGALSRKSQITKVAAPKEPKPARSPRARFLKEAHERACRIFGTTLGPEANNAHRNHFHVDLAPRKRSNYCE